MAAHGDEDDEEEEVNQSAKVIRHSFQMQADSTSPAGVEMRVIASYMKDTHLESIMSNLCHSLLSQPKLPYNPYPGFVRRLRHLAEGFRVFDPSSSSSLSSSLSESELHSKVMRTSVAGMWGVDGSDNVWGLKHRASAMDGKGLKQYDWLIQGITPRGIAGIEEHHGYAGQILVALVGPAAFTGTFYTEVNSLDIRLEYVIYGVDVNVGLDLFVKSIVEDVDATIREDCPHQMLSVCIPSIQTSTTLKNAPSSLSARVSMPGVSRSDALLSVSRSSHTSLLNTRSVHATESGTRPSNASVASTVMPRSSSLDFPSSSGLWSVEDIQDRRDDFIGAIRNAVKKKQLITQQCMFLLHEGKSLYKLGSKQYVLHFVETSAESEEESFFSFAELPYITAHQGIFLKRADCETYLMTMTRHPHIARQLEAEQSSQITNLRAQQIIAQLQDGDREAMVVYSDVVVTPIRDKLEQELSTLDPVMDAFKVVQLVLDLILLDRTKWKNEVLVEIRHFLHSTAHQWHIAMCYNTMIQQVLQCKVIKQGIYSQQKDRLVKDLLTQYKEALLKVLDTSLHNRSSDQHTAHTIVKSKLQQLCTHMEYRDRDHQQLMKALINLQLYCATVLIQLIEDAMSFFQQLDLKDLIKKGQKEVSDVKTSTGVKSSKSRANVKKKQSKTQLVQKKSSPDIPAVILHGVEDKKVTQQRNQFLVLEDVRRESSCPRIMATEAVLIQYSVDVKLDKVWHDFLLKLFSEPWLPPNPYPSLVTHLRQAALRMQLYQETNEQLSDQILHLQSVKLADKINCVFNIPGSDAYGCTAALASLDTNSSGFPKIAAVTKRVVNKLAITRKGQFQIFYGVAICGLCPLYGKLIPYLNELVLHENYYIKGPMGAHSDAIQLFAKFVYENILEIYEQSMYVILGVCFERTGLLAIQQIVDNKEQFTAQLMHAVHLKQDVYIKLYQGIGWRYIGIVKYLRFHYLFVDNAEDRCEPFYPGNHVHTYQSVFLTLKEASFHFQQSRVSSSPAALRSVNSELDRQMQDTMRDSNHMLQVYRVLVPKALLNKDAACIAELWRVMHSVAFQLDYVNSLNYALQDLIHSAVTNPQSFQPLSNLDDKKGNKTTKTYPLKEETLTQLYRAFRTKVMEILQEPCAFTPISLTTLVVKKLDQIAKLDSLTVPGTLLDVKTLGLLQDIADILQPLKDAVAMDMLAICPHSQEIFHQVMSKGKTGS